MVTFSRLCHVVVVLCYRTTRPSGESNMSHAQQYALEQIALRSAAKRPNDRTRHKCFVSYHAVDTDEVAGFLDNFGTEFIGKTVGVTDEDDFIDSQDSGYIMDTIRTKDLSDSSVTIVWSGNAPGRGVMSIGRYIRRCAVANTAR